MTRTVPFSPTAPAGALPLDELRLTDPELYQILINAPAYVYARQWDFHSTIEARRRPWRSGVLPAPSAGHQRPPVPSLPPLRDWRVDFTDPFALNDLADWTAFPTPFLWDPSGWIFGDSTYRRARPPIGNTSTGILRMTAEIEPVGPNYAVELYFGAQNPDGSGVTMLAGIDASKVYTGALTAAGLPINDPSTYDDHLALPDTRYWLRAIGDLLNGRAWVGLYTLPPAEVSPFIQSADDLTLQGWTYDMGVSAMAQPPSLALLGSVRVRDITFEEAV